jgi:ABC-2 type transport system permease protein
MSAVAVARTPQPIPGPSAVGGGRRRFFSLVWLLASIDFKLNYFGTAFGYVWSLLRPLMLFAVLYTVFAKGLNIGGSIPHYPDILLLNIMLYQFFAEATVSAVGCVVNRENIVRKMQFPRLVIPLSVVLTSIFNLCLNLVAVLIFFVATGVEPRLSWLALPLLVAVLALFTTGLALLLSALYVRFRDVAQIWAVLTLVLFYSSPIIYPIEQFPHAVRFLLLVNPLAPILVTARQMLVDPSSPSVVGAAGSAAGYVGPALTVLVLCALGAWVFTRAAPRIAEEL